ncbi:MAG TPA: hypothetical protein VKV18_04295 [Chthonomonas sp.]|uniref:hypothetical protein n=1 Tax=Chthonomonas sp. TaxID=2282153 RepID=UPI002B4B2A19|nr:hypothetical protein [Chthonomonas sp.]HLI47895.1 hypothetical protein [Chthonomonas sp.]
MNKEASPAMIVAAIVVLVLILAFLGWRYLRGPAARAGSNPYANAPANVKTPPPYNSSAGSGGGSPYANMPTGGKQ